MPATEKNLYNLPQMHKVFCVAVLAFSLATLLMLYKDHDDEWRAYQSEFDAIKAEQLKEGLDSAYEAAAGSHVQYSAAVEEATAELKALTEQVENSVVVVSGSLAEALREAGRIDSGESVHYGELKEYADELALAFDLQGRHVRGVRADRDVARANYDLAISVQAPSDRQDILLADFTKLQGIVDREEKAWDDLETALTGATDALKAATEARDEKEKDVKAKNAEVVRLTETLDQIRPLRDSLYGDFKSGKRSFMQWPIIDGFNSPRKVVQDWLPNLHIKLGMTSTARFDRCRTCHQGIADFGAGNVPMFPAGHPTSEDPADWVKEGVFPQPFSGHPRPDVYLTAASPHPLPSFGCTICHDGTGSATSFHNAQHGPNDPIEEHEWHNEYGYSHNHFWEYPMFPKRLLQSTCLKCHHDVIELGVNPTFGETAPQVYDGWQLIRQYGCFGCHEVNGFDAGKRIGPDLRLEPTAEEQAKYDTDPNMIPGQMRKVGPSLKHVAQKTTGNWIAYWTEDPQRFRPATRMPKFFGLTNLLDHEGLSLSKVEIAAISHFLVKQSEDVTLDAPAEGYAPDAERGKELFATRGCLACHSFDADEFKGANSDFGPNLTRTKEKLLPLDPGQPIASQKSFQWLYTWIRDPQRHHPRSRMPNLFLVPEETVNGVIDPAADIAAFLAGDGPKEWDAPNAGSKNEVRALARLHLAGKLLTVEQFNEFFGDEEQGVEGSRRFPIPKDRLKGDEVALVYAGEGRPDDQEWSNMVMNYLGRRSVSRYGCYACHDINGFGESRPIGTALQDWGRKDPSRLAPEHIHEFLHHHGEPDGSSTQQLVEKALADSRAGVLKEGEDRDNKMRKAFFYESLNHHGRPGFIFQKLRDPRSYDYMKTESKTYTERLVMPKFPLNEQQIEAISTFVLGLVAEPPAPEYVYTPDQRTKDRNDGEILMRKFNCVSCHLTDMDKIEYAVEPGELTATEIDPGWHDFGLKTLLSMRKPVPAYTGRRLELVKDGESQKLETVEFRGMLKMMPDPAEEDPDFREYTFTNWEPASLSGPGHEGDDGVKFPSSLMVIPERRVAKVTPAKTGQYAQWLVSRKVPSRTPDGFDPKKFDSAWQAGPPPLFREGDKVQTEWLYRFLKQPEKIRHTTDIRMPKFTLSDLEARTLASYFAAADGAEYPYKDIPQAGPEYLSPAQAEFMRDFADRHTHYDGAPDSYLQESWTVLSTELCIGCHSVAGREFVAKPGDPNVTHAPDLERVRERLRPEWITSWLSNPAWITPYTAMPLPFAAGKIKEGDKLFHGDPGHKTLGARDALLNYYYMLERKVEPTPLPPAPVQASTN